MHTSFTKHTYTYNYTCVYRIKILGRNFVLYMKTFPCTFYRCHEEERGEGDGAAIAAAAGPQKTSLVTSVEMGAVDLAPGTVERTEIESGGEKLMLRNTCTCTRTTIHMHASTCRYCISTFIDISCKDSQVMG